MLFTIFFHICALNTRKIMKRKRSFFGVNNRRDGNSYEETPRMSSYTKQLPV